MKTDKLAVIVSINDGSCYQVCLTEEEESCVLGLLEQLHNGTVKCIDEKLELKFERRSK